VRPLPGVFRRHPRRALTVLCLLGLGLCFLAAEGVLRAALPFSFATVGHVRSSNAVDYGWGFKPFERVWIADPDTGVVYRDRLNNHGWRDLVRSYENPTNAYRILVLGDSLTFGAIVPLRQVYTRVLEQMLREEGYNVEVISIGYGMWGTDQQLEALALEGLRYRPNVVLVQFCGNDLADNIYYLPRGKRPRGLKPFYYTLDAAGELVRTPNPHFRHTFAGDPGEPAGTLKGLVLQSEVAKRCYGLFLYHMLHESPAPTVSPGGGTLRETEYQVNRARLAQLEEVFGLSAESPFVGFLRQRMDSRVGADDLRAEVRAAGMGRDEEVILRLLERRHFSNAWARRDYNPSPQDLTSFEWRLYFALLLRMKERSSQAGAAFALLNTTEVGNYEWARYWRRVSAASRDRDIYLEAQSVLRAFAERHSIGWVPNLRPYTRARNDPHPNGLGNAAMAADVRDYLLASRGAELRHWRHAPQAATSSQ
jgi:hypothetical protein